MTYDDQIEEIFNFFDFNKVRIVMSTLQWQWVDINGWYYPTVFDMENHAENLLKDVAGKEMMVECGGFRAECRNGMLSLSFVVENWFVEEEI